MSESNAVQYEVVNKATGEATPVTLVEFGGDTVRVECAIGAIIFPHAPTELDLQNDEFFVREIGTHMATDGVHNTDEAGVVDGASESVDTATSEEATA